jgi:RNA polymerase sigma-70 factor (ECF subfamily)
LRRLADHCLARRILRGDESAFGRLVALHHKAVYRTLRHLCRDAHWAEDLTQQTFLSAWRHLPGYRGESSLKVWLHRIAYRQFIDWWRRRQAQAVAQAGLVSQAEPPPASGPLDGLIADERRRILLRAVDRLDEASREVVVLHYLQGLSFREVAQVLGQPAGTVKSRVSVALGRLRGVLERGHGNGHRQEMQRDSCSAVAETSPAPPAEAASP